MPGWGILRGPYPLRGEGEGNQEGNLGGGTRRGSSIWDVKPKKKEIDPSELRVDGYVLVMGILPRLMTGMYEVREDWLCVLYQETHKGRTSSFPTMEKGLAWI